MINARIFDIQRFSVHDGPGIRTVVFFKGCNLRCSWCHNPESLEITNSLEYHEERCISCNRCFEICDNNVHFLDEFNIHQIEKKNCKGCFECVNNCFAEALIGVGKEIDVEDLLEQILTDSQYYRNSGGGVTFSGGECMLQVDFLEKILERCKAEKIHIAIDTAGNIPWSYFERILDKADLFLFDIKAADPVIHKKNTGVDNKLLLENLKKLSDKNKKIIVRIPLIMGVNNKQFIKIAKILKPLKLERVEILPYHKLGESKYSVLGIKNTSIGYRVPTDLEIYTVIKQMKSNGINAVKK